jgi:NADPH:quinone reductase-like Zn-dependent oxidoreductase
MEVDKPQAADHQVLIQIKAAGVNPVDTKVRAGTSGLSKRLRLPIILGWDVSGVVTVAGKAVSVVKPGDEVFGCIEFPGPGNAYAEYVATDPGWLAKKPANISFEEAAAIPLAGLTAYQAIEEQLKIRAGQTILVQAAAGGVGHLAVQFAKILGATVYGTASAKNEAFLKSLGVDQVIDYKNERFEDKVVPLDAVLDAMGGAVLYRSIPCVKAGGVVVCLPSSTKDDPEAMALAERHGVTLTWPLMYPDGGQMKIIAGLLEQGKLRVHVDQTFSLDHIASAHEAVESHRTRGKIVVKID